MRRFFFRLAPALALAASACGLGGGPPEKVVSDSADAATDPRAVYGVPASENVVVTPVEIELVELPAGWSGMRIAALSDFQLGLWPDNERVARAAVQRAVAERPDLIVLLGDYVARGGDYAALDRVLAPLKGRRVFAVLGNEDMAERSEGPDSTRIRTVQALERNGVTVLLDRRAPFARGGDTAYVAGVDPYVARRPDWRRAEIYGGLPGAPSTMLLLAHMPVAAVTIPTDRYPAMLAGNTFCGNVEVPGTPRLSWVNSEVFPGTPEPATRRIYRVRGATLFITCGVGYSFVPVRFGHPPEVALITLRGVGVGPAGQDSARAAPAVNVDSLIQAFDPGERADTTGGGAAGDTAAPDTTGR